MATVAEQGKRGSTARYDVIVEAKLAKAQGRIRNLDTTTGLLGFVVLTLGYALFMAVLDRRFELALGVRQFAFVLYAGCSLGILATLTFRPFLRRVNPYYAACQIEKQIPSAKNSVVNWIDLHEQDLPSSIKGAVGQRAAQDLGKVNLEEAFQGRHTVWLGISTMGLGLALVVLLLLSGLPQFLSLLRRAFIPYEGGIAKQTQIIVKTGETTVPVEQPATILVEVNGKIPDPRQPDALRLLLRYRDSDPYEDPILLDEVEAGRRDWQAIVPASRVRNGFWYKVKGGDDESQEYRVGVRSSPLIKGFEAKLHYPKYMGWTDKGTFDPNLRDLAGTEVTLIVHTNRAVRKGSLEFELEKERRSLPASPIKDDPQAMLLRFVLDKSGSYGVRFTSSDGEEYTDSMRYSLLVIQDRAPNVVLKEPGQDVTLPANGTLQLKGSADDDIGLTKITLRLQVVDGQALDAKAYRQGKDFRLSDGSYPKMLEYQDLVDLADLKDAQGAKAVIAEGKSIEYWLEAEDNHEPTHHVGESEHYKVTLAPPDKDSQQQQKKNEQAKQEKKKHDKKQDNDLKKEGEQRKEESKGGQGTDSKPEPNNQEGEKPDSKPNQGGKDQPKPKDGKPDGKPQKPQPGEGSQGSSQQNDGTKQAEDRLKEAAEGGDKGQNESKDQKANAKDDPSEQPKGEGKGQGKDEKPSPKGGVKGSDRKGEQNKENGQEKNEGNPKADGAQDKAESKQEGNPQPSAAKGEPKEQKGDKAESASAKSEGKPEANPAQATDKGAGQGDPKDQAAAKAESAKPDGQSQPAGAKEGKKTDDKSEGVAKSQSPPVEKSAPKDAGATGSDAQQAKADAKDEKRGGGPPNAEDKPTKQEDAAKAGSGKAEKPTEKEKAELQAQTKKENQGATAEDVKNLEKEAQGADEKKERDTLDKLSQIHKFADDPAAREAADKALDKMLDKMKERTLEPDKTKQPPPKQDQPDRKDSDSAGTPKEGPGKNNPDTSAGKGDPSEKKNDQKGTGKSAGAPTSPSDPNDPNKKPADPTNPADAQVKDKGDPDKNPKISRPGSGLEEKPLANRDSGKPPEGGEGDPENLKKASQLQLENIRKLIKEHPEILDKAGMSTEDLGRYFDAKQKQIADYDRMAREKANIAANENEATGKPAGAYTDIRAQQLKPEVAKSGNMNTPGAGAPPPEFRDMYNKKFITTKPKPNP